MHITITVIVIFFVAMIVAVRMKDRGDGPPVRYDYGGLLSDDAKQSVLQDLVQQEKNIFTRTQKEAILKKIIKSGNNNLTVEEKKYILEQLQK